MAQIKKTARKTAPRPDPLGATSLSVEVGGQAVTSTTDAGVAIWSWESPPNACFRKSNNFI